MFRTVVIPIADGDGANLAVAHGAALARQAGAAVELLTVRPTYLDPGSVRRHLAEVAAAQGLDDARLRLVDAGDPATAIAGIGSEPGNLLCLATHARRPLAELALGSVSAEVVRTCRRPILLVGPRCGPAPAAYKSLVAALDTSELAETILPVVAEWCRHIDITPWLFEVLPARVPFERGDDEVAEGAYVHHVADQLGLAGVNVGWDTTHERHVARSIAGFAETHGPSIVALSTHGRSGLSQLVMGSVAMAVAHHATSPVLVRHPNAVREEEVTA
jgi:nucleotide-binding universal stress UspA family protein